MFLRIFINKPGRKKSQPFNQARAVDSNTDNDGDEEGEEEGELMCP